MKTLRIKWELHMKGTIPMDDALSILMESDVATLATAIVKAIRTEKGT
jgi:hypothetical protein